MQIVRKGCASLQHYSLSSPLKTWHGHSANTVRHGICVGRLTLSRRRELRRRSSRLTTATSPPPSDLFPKRRDDPIFACGSTLNDSVSSNGVAHRQARTVQNTIGILPMTVPSKSRPGRPCHFAFSTHRQWINCDLRTDSQRTFLRSQFRPDLSTACTQRCRRAPASWLR